MRGLATSSALAAVAVIWAQEVNASERGAFVASSPRCCNLQAASCLPLAPFYGVDEILGRTIRRGMVTTCSDDDTTFAEEKALQHVLPYDTSAHNSATISIPPESNDDFTVETFRSRLEATCCALRELDKSSLWIEVPMSRARLIEETIELGFEYHHAEGKIAKLNLWLRDGAESKVPEYATHHVGVGSVVVNSKGEILCVRELRKNYMPWKVPGGLSELGETIAEAAQREVMEETGIPTTFHSVLGFRHTHGLANGRSDMYFVCRLDPIEESDEHGNAIIPEPCAQACEIEATKWVPLNEYRDMVNGADGGSGHPMMRNIMEIYDSGLEIAQREVKSVVPGRKPNPLYVPKVNDSNKKQ